MLAQEKGFVQWSEPVNLSNSPTSSTYPVTVADKYGYIHVFWGEDLEGVAVDPQNSAEASNSIMYVRGDGQTWSQPVDIFFIRRDGDGYMFPAAVVDPANTIHLAWRSLGGVLYSSAPAYQAQNAKAWQPVQLIMPARGGEPPRWAVGHQGGIHLVFASWENTQYGEKDGNIYYVNSSDGGQSWSEPVQLSAISRGDETIASRPRIAVDSQGRMHVVWHNSEPPGYTGSSIYYINSEDGGRSWSVPIEIAHGTEEESWSSTPQIAALSSAEIHIVWVCGNLPHRCHRWSQDGGRNWSPTIRLFGDLHSLAGWDSLVSDGDGTLYWITQLRYPSALYYTWWIGNRWADPQIFHSDFLHGGHYPNLAVSLGHQLNLVIVEQNEKEVFYFKGITAARSLTPVPTPISKPTSKPNSVSEIVMLTTIPTAAPSTPEVRPSSYEFPRKEQSPNYPIVMGLLPVLGLIVIITVSKIYLARNKLR